MDKSVKPTEPDTTCLIITLDSFKNEHAITISRKEIVDAKLKQKTIIFDLINFETTAPTPAEFDSFKTLLPMCNLILGIPKDYTSWTRSQTLIQALQSLRQMTAATIVVILDESRHLVFEDDAIQDLEDKISQFDHVKFKSISQAEKQVVMNHYRARVVEK